VVRCPLDTPGRPGPGTGTVPGGVFGLSFFFRVFFGEKSGDTDFSTRVRMVVGDDDEERYVMLVGVVCAPAFCRTVSKTMTNGFYFATRGAHFLVNASNVHLVH
jgi:hypothetical protein